MEEHAAYQSNAFFAIASRLKVKIGPPPEELGESWLQDLVEVGCANNVLTRDENERPNPIDMMIDAGIPVMDVIIG